MSICPFGIDSFHPAVAVTDAGNTIVINGTSRTITAGDYFQILGGTPAYMSMGEAIADEIAAVIGGTCTVDVVTPLLSPQQDRCGLRFTASASFTLDMGDAAWTLDRRWLGYPEDWGLQVASDASNQTRSRQTLGLMWSPFDRVSSKLADYGVESYGTKNSRYRWEETKVRTYDYEEVPAALVRPRAQEQPEWARLARRGFGDTGGTYLELWQIMTLSRPVLVSYDNARTDLKVLQGAWELCQMVDEDLLSSFSASLPGVEPAGEFYDLTFELEVIDPGTYRHD